MIFWNGSLPVKGAVFRPGIIDCDELNKGAFTQLFERISSWQSPGPPPVLYNQERFEA